MVILTFVYVGATLLMAYLSWRANRISSKSLNQALEIEKERNRPYLVFDVEHKQSLLYAVLKNLGNTGAFNVSVKINPPLESNFGGNLKQSSLTSKTISFLSPHRTISDLIGSGPEFYKRHSEPIFEGSIQYSNARGIVYTENFVIDLNYLLDIAHTLETDLGKEMQNLVREVRDISRTVEKAQKTMERKLKENSTIES